MFCSPSLRGAFFTRRPPHAAPSAFISGCPRSGTCRLQPIYNEPVVLAGLAYFAACGYGKGDATSYRAGVGDLARKLEGHGAGVMSWVRVGTQI